MAATSFFALCGLMFVVGCLAKTRFDGYSVFRIYPDTKFHAELLNTQVDNPELDFWSDIRWEGRWVDIQASAAYKENFKIWLRRHHFVYHVTIEDLQRLIDEQEAASLKDAANSPRDFTQYHEYDWIMTWLDQKAAECGTTCSTFSIGTSFEGNILKVLKIATGGTKQALWIDGGIHAREWISPATTMYFIERFINDRSDPDVINFLNMYDVYFLPVVNPDGYKWTWTDNRMWRKSRSTYAVGCVGADLNRNFDFQWGTVGSSNNPCSDTFHGVAAFSEPEARTIGNYVSQLQMTQGVKLFLTLHSYGQLLLLPYGYTQQHTPTHDQLMVAGNAFGNTLFSVHGTRYEVGTSYDILYESSGTSRDWAYGVPGIQYVFTIELRDTGTHGFVLPPEQIIPTGEETWAGFKAMVNAFD